MRKKSGEVRAVVDTNLFVSGLLNTLGTPAQLIAALRRDDFTLVLSEPLYLEYRRVLTSPKFTQKYGLTPEEVADFLFLVDTSARRVQPSKKLPVTVRDHKDEKVLAAALPPRADYLVTGDDDLRALRDDERLEGLQIVTAKEFLDILAAVKSENSETQ